MITYDDILLDSGAEARAREAELLGRSAQLMRTADGADATPAQRTEAARFTERLWSHLLDDLASPANALDPALRADLISIGIFVMRTSAGAARGEGDFGGAIAVTDQLRAGLAGGASSHELAAGTA